MALRTVFNLDLSHHNALYIDYCEDEKYRVYIDEKIIGCLDTEILAYKFAIRYMAERL